MKRNLCEFIPIARNKKSVVSADIDVLPLVGRQGQVPEAFLCLAVKWFFLERIPIISVIILLGIFVCDFCGLRSAFRRVGASRNGHLSLVLWIVGVCGFFCGFGFFLFKLFLPVLQKMFCETSVQEEGQCTGSHLTQRLWWSTCFSEQECFCHAVVCFHPQ